MLSTSVSFAGGIIGQKIYSLLFFPHPKSKHFDLSSIMTNKGVPTAVFPSTRAPGDGSHPKAGVALQGVIFEHGLNWTWHQVT